MYPNLRYICLFLSSLTVSIFIALLCMAIIAKIALTVSSIVHQNNVVPVEGSAASVGYNNWSYNKDVVNQGVGFLVVILGFLGLMSTNLLDDFDGRQLEMLELLIADLFHTFLLLVAVPTLIYLKNADLRMHVWELLVRHCD